MRGEDLVVSREVDSRRRHEEREPGEQVQRLQPDVRRTIAIRGLQL